MHLIFKEAINNVERHADVNHVEIRMEATSGVFTMVVHDEGDISNEGTRLTGHGLRNMKMRAQRLGGTLQVSRNGGYEVCLTAPLLR